MTQVSAGSTHSKTKQSTVIDANAGKGKPAGAAWGRAKDHLGLSGGGSQKRLQHSVRQIFQNLTELTTQVQTALNKNDEDSVSALAAADTLQELVHDLGKQFAQGDLADAGSIEMGSQSFNPQRLLQEISASLSSTSDAPFDELQSDYPLLTQFQNEQFNTSTPFDEHSLGEPTSTLRSSPGADLVSLAKAGDSVSETQSVSSDIRGASLRSAAAGLPEVLALIDSPQSVHTDGSLVDLDLASLGQDDELLSLSPTDLGSKFARYADGIKNSLAELQNTSADSATLKEITSKLHSTNRVFRNALREAKNDPALQAEYARHCTSVFDAVIDAVLNNKALFIESGTDTALSSFLEAFSQLKETVSLDGGAALLALQNLANLQEPGADPESPNRSLASLMTPKMQGDPRNQILAVRALTRIAHYLSVLDTKAKQADALAGHRQIDPIALVALKAVDHGRLFAPLKTRLDQAGGNSDGALARVLSNPQSFRALVASTRQWVSTLADQWDKASHAGTLQQVNSVYTTGMNLGSRSTRLKQFQNELFGTLGHEIQWSAKEGQPSLVKYVDQTGRLSDNLADNFDTLMTRESLVQTNTEKGSFNSRRFQSAWLAANMAYDGVNLNTRAGLSSENRFRVDALSLDQKLKKRSLIRLTELTPKANNLQMQVDLQKRLEAELQPKMHEYFAEGKAQQLISQATSRDELAQIAIMAINATSSERRIVFQSDLHALLNVIYKWQGEGLKRNFDGSRIGIDSTRFTAPSAKDRAKLEKYLARVLAPEIEMTQKQGRHIQTLMTKDSLNTFNSAVRKARASQPFRAMTGGFLGKSAVRNERQNLRLDALSSGQLVSRGKTGQMLVPGPQASRIADYFQTVSSGPLRGNPVHFHDSARNRLSSAISGLMKVSGYLGGALSGSISGIVDAVRKIDSLSTLKCFTTTSRQNLPKAGQLPSRRMAEEISVRGVRGESANLNEINSFALAAPNSEQGAPNLRQILQLVEDQLALLAKTGSGEGAAISEESWLGIRTNWSAGVAQAMEQAQNEAISHAANTIEQLENINNGYELANHAANRTLTDLMDLVNAAGTGATLPPAQHIDAVMNSIGLVSSYLNYAQAYNTLYMEGMKAARL